MSKAGKATINLQLYRLIQPLQTLQMLTEPMLSKLLTTRDSYSCSNAADDPEGETFKKPPVTLTVETSGNKYFKKPHPGRV